MRLALSVTLDTTNRTDIVSSTVASHQRQQIVKLVLQTTFERVIVHALRVILVTSYKELPVFRTIVIQVLRVRDVRLV